MKLTKALSLILTVAMLFGTLALGVSALDSSNPAVGALAPITDATLRGYQEVAHEAAPEGSKAMSTLSDGTTYSAPDTAVVYTINNEEELVLFSKIVNSGKSFFQVQVLLMRDMDMTGITGFEPIGNASNIPVSAVPNIDFAGDFNGNGYTIKNLKMESDKSGVVNVALFGAVSEGAVRNLVIDESCSFTYTGDSEYARTAGVVAYAYAAGGAEHLGTYSGVITTYVIKNVKNNATVTASAGIAGGIVAVADAWTGNNGTIQQCTQTADVIGFAYAGGIVGALKTHNGGTRQVNLDACEVGKENGGNIVVKALENCANECGNAVNGTITNTNSGYAATIETIEITEDMFVYDETVRGYSYYNMERVDTSEMPRVTEYNNTSLAFKIVDHTDLVKLSELVNNGNQMVGRFIYLANNIDMSTVADMKPIGYDPAISDYSVNSEGKNDANDKINAQTKMFKGTFDGQGYTIDNLKISVDSGFCGLFGTLRNGTIQNVVLGSGCSFTTSNIYAGSIAGRMIIWANETQTIIKNCYSAAAVTSTNANGKAGGLVGLLEGGTNALQGSITNSTNAGPVKAAIYCATILAEGRRPVIANYNVNMGVLTSTGTATPALMGSANSAGQLKYNVCIYDSKFVQSGNAAGDGNIYPRTIESGECSTKEISGVTFADDLAVYNKFTTYATFVGAQMSTDGKSVRLLAVVNSLDAFKVGFRLSAETDADVFPDVDYTTDTVFGSIIADGEVVTAESLGGKYIVVLTVKNIPADAVSLGVAALTQMTDGGEIVADSKTADNIIALNANA